MAKNGLPKGVKSARLLRLLRLLYFSKEVYKGRHPIKTTVTAVTAVTRQIFHLLDPPFLRFPQNCVTKRIKTTYHNGLQICPHANPSSIFGTLPPCHFLPGYTVYLAVMAAQKFAGTEAEKSPLWARKSSRLRRKRWLGRERGRR